jgi:hypothetical protein
MKRTTGSPHLHVVRREAGELSDHDIERLMAIGLEQAALMDQLQEALEAADELRALGVARKLVGLEKKVGEQ